MRGGRRGGGGLLGDGGDAVAFLEAGAGDGDADRGGIVDVGGADDADGGGEAANDLAGRGVLDLLGDADDLKLIADLDAGFGADVEDDLAAIDGGDEAIDCDGAHGDLGGIGDQVGGELIDGGLGGLADDGFLEVAGAEVDVTAAEAVPVAAAAEQRGGGAAGLARCPRRRPEISPVSTLMMRALMATLALELEWPMPPMPIAVPAAASAAHVLVLGLVAELGDGADDDGVNAGQLAQARGGGGVGAIGVGEVLLGHELIEGLALDRRSRCRL